MKCDKCGKDVEYLIRTNNIARYGIAVVYTVRYLCLDCLPKEDEEKEIIDNEKSE